MQSLPLRDPTHVASSRPSLLDRGESTTRVEAFVDAAFAFALTLLLIAGDHIPASVQALVEALKGLPASALSFMLILKFWSGHVKWTKRYGLDDALTNRLSLLLVFLVLIFVYPMRMVFEALCNSISRGYLPTTFYAGVTDIPVLFIVYGLAFGSLSLVMAWLYLHAWRLRDRLGLSDAERIHTRIDGFSWLLFSVVATISILSALVIPARPESGWWMGFPGFLYFSLNIATPLFRKMADRQVSRLAKAST
jgi:uncharacterized membrane protein